MPFSMLYIQECAPPHLRGIAANGFQFWAGVGSVIGSVVDNYAAKMPGKTGYQLCCALFVILPVIIIASAPFVPESPRWLIAHGKHHESLHALQRLRGTEYPEALIAAEFREIKETWEIEEQMAHGANILDMFRGIDLRRTCLAVAGACMQNSSGAMFLLIYGTYFFEVAGSDEPFTDGIILSCTMLASSCIMFLVIRYLGRRTIMMLATLCQGFSMLIIAIVYTVAPTSQAALKCLVGFIVIFIFFYGGFTAPVAWLWPGEIPSTRLRAYTLGLGTAVGFVLGVFPVLKGRKLTFSGSSRTQHPITLIR
jgi:MFS transporter, SP family, sugar:H+ symporter